MNDLGEDGEAGTPGMRSEMRTYPSLFFFFTPAAPPLCDRPSFFSEKVWHVCCPHSISHGTLFEKTIHACCQRVFVRWMESPPSTSSPTYQFGLNPLEMSKSRREQKGLTHRDPLCSRGGPRRRFGVRRGSLSLQARVKQTHRKLRLSHTNTHKDALLTRFCCQKPQTSESLPLPVWKRSASPGIILFFLLFFQHPFTTHPPHVFSSCKSGCGISWESASSWQGESLFPPAENFLRRYLLVFLASKSLRVRVRSKFIFLALSRCCNGLDLMQSLRTLLQPTPQIAAGRVKGVLGPLQLSPRWCLSVHGGLLLFSSLYLKRRVCVKLSST